MGPTPRCARVRRRGIRSRAEDEYGYPVGDETPVGAGCTDVLSPFEYATPPTYTRLEDSPFIVRLRWRTKDWCEEHYDPELMQGVNWGKMPMERSLQLLRAIATQTDVSSTPDHLRRRGKRRRGRAEYELWHRPTQNLYPHGLVARVLGDSSPTLVIREEEGLPGPLPYRTQTGQPLFPFVHGVYEDLGGRMNGRGALEPWLNKNDQLNQLDSMAALTEQRMANPVWLEPKGAEVKSSPANPASS
jgi:hypothetical protein